MRTVLVVANDPFVVPQDLEKQLDVRVVRGYPQKLPTGCEAVFCLPK